MLFYFLRDRWALWFWSTNSSSHISLSLKPSLFSKLILNNLFHGSPQRWGSGISGRFCRNLFQLLLPFCFVFKVLVTIWSLYFSFYCLLFLRNGLPDYNAPLNGSVSSSCSLCSRSNSIHGLYCTCRCLISYAWWRGGFFNKFQQYSFANSLFP